MNLNFDMSAVTRALSGMLNELRQKRLWPVAAVLLAAMVAVPFVLGKSSKPAQQAQVPAPVPPPAQATTLPALNVQSTPAHSQLRGPSRNPFGFATGAGPAATSASAPNLAVVSSVATAANNAVSALNSASANSSGSSAGGSSTASGGSSATGGSSASSGSGTSSSSGNPPSITGNAKPKPAPSGLSSTQSYDVSLSITNSANGVNAVDPLERLSLLPSKSQGLLVELGVLKGGNKVLFAVQPGTVVYGPGTCTPGPVDCEILALGQDQTEAVASRSNPTATLFAITGITTTGYTSSAAANRARERESAAGRSALNSSNLPALSLFRYERSLGAVVNLSNLTVGG